MPGTLTKYWKQIDDVLSQQAPPLKLGSILTTALRAELTRLSVAGQTDAQILTSLLSTYGPIIAAIATCRAEQGALIRFQQAIDLSDAAQHNGRPLTR